MPFYWILPLGLFALVRGKPKRYKKSVNLNTGIVLSSDRIEIINKSTIINVIDNVIFTNQNLDFVRIFEKILLRLNKCLYNKMKSDKLKEKEKIILSILFMMCYTRFFHVMDDDLYHSHYYPIMIHILDLDIEDQGKLNSIWDRFNVEYSWPSEGNYLNKY